MSVDESAGTHPAGTAAPAAAVYFGVVVPKRHARRAVTRSLLKRAMRAAVERAAHRLAPGLWIVRLRAPFDTGLYPSAASVSLRGAARAELEALLAGCTQSASAR